MFLRKTKARLKIGSILRGAKTNFRVEGCLLFREWDATDKRWYYWEEWELLGLENYDSWVEYDHYEKKVSLYEPVRFATVIDPKSFRAGQTFTLNDATGLVYNVRVKEVGEGEIVAIHGKNTYQVFEGERMTYATLQMTRQGGTSQQTVTVEKYNDREYDAYKKTTLSPQRQKRLFGRTIAPLPWFEWIFIALVVLLVGWSLIDEYRNESSTSSGRSVYGGSSGGLGK